MPLKAIHDSQEEIAEQYRDLYSERNGKWELTGIEGVKTQADVDRLQTSLQKERDDHKATKDKLAPFANTNPEDIAKLTEEHEELKLRFEALPKDKDGNVQIGGDIDEAKLDKLVEARVATKTAPLQRDLDAAVKENAELKQANETYATKETNRTISDAVREAGVKSKVIGEAMEDALMLAERVFEVNPDTGEVTTKDGMGVTPGVTPEIWFTEMQPKRSHWWPPSQGGGAGGAGAGGGAADNPWSSANWNITKQGEVLKTKGADHAARLAQSVGSFVGAAHPPQGKGQQGGQQGGQQNHAGGTWRPQSQ